MIILPNVLHHVLNCKLNAHQLQEANEVVKLMFKQMTRSDLGYQYFETIPGQSIYCTRINSSVLHL